MTSPKAKKSLGQHWLYDDESLNRMVELAEVKESDVIIEVGPGLGTLTEKLDLAARKVLAVEFDTELAELLAEKTYKNVEVIESDIRSYDFGSVEAGYKVVANIPYYLTSHLIKQLLETNNKPALIVLLVQKEVAERICAKPGKLSVLGVASQFFADVSLGDVVEAELFEPAPKVDSQIVVLRPKTELPDIDSKLFFRVVKAGFGEKRKKLTNSLAGGLAISKEQASSITGKLGLSENARAQELTMDQWVQLANTVSDTMRVND